MSRAEHAGPCAGLANPKNTFFMDQEQSCVWDKDIWDSLECYIDLPDNDNPKKNPLSFAYICEQQQVDPGLLASLEKNKNNYFYKPLEDDIEDIICHFKNYKDPMTQWTITFPEKITKEAVNWFHQVMGHPS